MGRMINYGKVSNRKAANRSAAATRDADAALSRTVNPDAGTIARRNKADSLAVLANTDPAKLPKVKKIPPKG